MIPIERGIYFMLKNNEIGPYVETIIFDGEKTEEFSELKINFEKFNLSQQNLEILDYITASKKSEDLSQWNFDAWSTDEEMDEAQAAKLSELLYISNDPELVKLLVHSNIFVDENFKQIEYFPENNSVALNIIEVEDQDEGIKLKSLFLLNEQYSDITIIDDDYIFCEDKFFKLDLVNDSIYELKNFQSSLSSWELESFLSIFSTYFHDIKINCLDYSIDSGEKRILVPEMIIEKISQDNSLYMKITLGASTMSYDFLKENGIEKIAIVNNMEKKIQISEIDMSGLSVAIEEITKALVKHQRLIKVRSGFYLDDDNMLILQEALAKEFIGKELLKFATKYRVVGAEKLKKYNIKTVKPKIVGSFKHSINFLEGNVKLDIEGEKFSIADILATYKTDSYIVLSDGTNALINHKYIEKLERIFNVGSSGDSVKISFFDLPIVEEMIEEKIFGQEFIKSANFFNGINQIENYETTPPNVRAEMRTYQEYGYKWLCYLVDNNLGGCLADDMGLGKTLQAIALLSKICDNKSGKSLVVMPKSLVFNWESEIKKFAPQIDSGIYYGNFRDMKTFDEHEVILTTYGTVRNDIEKISKIPFELVILDESQNIKNVNAQTTKAIMLLTSNNRLALSGTPIENNLTELYSLFRFLNPNMFGSLDTFNAVYANPIQRDNDKEVIQELRKKIYPFILRRIKKEVLKDLPDKIEQTVVIEMNHDQKKFYEERRIYYYDAVKAQIKEQGLGKSQFYLLQAINELRQITSCPESKNPKILSSKRKHLINSVADAVANGHKVLVFTNYIASIEGICRELDVFKIKYLTMTGATTDRQNLVDRFQKDSSYKVFVMTLKTGGVGLNLTSADTIFIYDPWWNKTVENQAVDRAYRIGQDRTVFSYKLILKDSIEEKILKLQGLKTELLENLISEDNASVKFLTEDDIQFIFGAE
ncbi:MAG: DEAD/DEAH box helicase [Fusobacteriaceae bacterium]